MWLLLNCSPSLRGCRGQRHARSFISQEDAGYRTVFSLEWRTWKENWEIWKTFVGPIDHSAYCWQKDQHCVEMLVSPLPPVRSESVFCRKLWTLPWPGVLLHWYRITPRMPPPPREGHAVANGDDSAWSSPVKAKPWVKTCSLRGGKQNQRRTNKPTSGLGGIFYSLGSNWRLDLRELKISTEGQ